MSGGGGGGAPPGGRAAGIAAALESLSPAELWAILSELQGLAAADADAARALLLAYPTLAAAVVRIQAMLGTLASPTPAYGAAVLAAGGAGGAGDAPPLPAPDEEQRALVRSILAMSDADVDALPPEQRDGAAQIRAALRSPLEVLEAIEAPALRAELLGLREQLTAVLGALPLPDER